LIIVFFLKTTIDATLCLSIVFTFLTDTYLLLIQKNKPLPYYVLWSQVNREVKTKLLWTRARNNSSVKGKPNLENIFYQSTLFEHYRLLSFIVFQCFMFCYNSSIYISTWKLPTVDTFKLMSLGKKWKTKTRTIWSASRKPH
jgi:hypothetical protein